MGRERRLHRAMMRGYPIPQSRQKHAIFINGTPHLSSRMATLHSECLTNDYHAFVEELARFLHPLLNEQQRRWLDAAYSAALAGEDAVSRGYSAVLEKFATDRSVDYMMEKLLMDKDVDAREPALEADASAIEARLGRWVMSLPDNPLGRYERKLFKKYLGSGTARSGEGYIKQVSGYLAERESFARIPMPDMPAYESALTRWFNSIALPLRPTSDGYLDASGLEGYLSRARKNTFGGYPFLANMADFVSSDEADPTTYADAYNEAALWFLFLSPRDKLRHAYAFVALERVQPGGASEIGSIEGDEIEYTHKANKQRFVQAQSAVFSHAYKFFVDGSIAHIKRMRPHFVADKFGEPAVTAAMEQVVLNCVQRAQPDSSTVLTTNIAGTDFTNFDSTQDVCLSNDNGYMIWRLLFPRSFTTFLIDPYVKCVYRKGFIQVPRYGWVLTTGVRSGMVDTNYIDTTNCGVCDAYELERWAQDHRFEPSDSNELLRLDAYYASAMANGDDRLKMTPCDALDLERYDAELGYVTQYSKQEITKKGDTLRNLDVTYLKTIECWDDTQGTLLRTDSVAKLILARLSPETIETSPHDASLVVDSIMSASRSSSSPFLWIYVDWMYKYLPEFQKLVDGVITLDQLVAKMVTEQMEMMRLRRGNRWMRRKGIDAAAVIEKMNTKFGYGDEGFRGNSGALNLQQPGSGLANLPQFRAIMAIAFERKQKGLLGSFFA